jgi:hypothetical protein
MLPAVNLPVVTAASPVEPPAAPQNSDANQGGITSFSGLLGLLGDATAELPATPEAVLTDREGGQDLPLEALVDGNRGETLPPLMEQTDPALAVSVMPAINATLFKETPHGQPVGNSEPESDPDADPELAQLLPVLPVNTTLQPAINQTVLREPGQEIAASQPLQEAAVRMQAINNPHTRELPATPVNLTNDQDVPELPVQSFRSSPEEMVKPFIRPADIDVVAQSFRRLVAPVPGNEARSSHEITSMLSAVQPLTTAPSSAQNSPQQLPGLTLDTPFQKTGWDQGVTEKIQWMVGQKLQGAEIRLNPEHLGPITVKIQMQNDQASVQFTAAHSVVREALEAAVPRLREMFDNQGIQLTDVDVSEHSFARQHKDREADTTHHTASMAESNQLQSREENSVSRWTTPVSAAGRLDLFV